jgi:hypothetical protein
MLARQPSPAIEERHYITLVVRDPEGRVVEEKTYETRSFTYADVLAIRMFSAWQCAGNCFSRLYTATPVWLLSATGSALMLTPDSTPLGDVDGVYEYPSLVFLGSGTSPDGGRTLGSPLGAAAIPTVSYTYDSQWFNVTVTAAFSFSEAATVREAMLAVQNYVPTAHTIMTHTSIIYDNFPPVSVPAGGSLTIQWVIAWKDYGALTENWGRLWQYALTLEKGAPNLFVNFTDDTGATVSIPWPNTYSGGLWALRLAWGTGTSPMSRSSYRLQSEAGSMVPGVTLAGTGFSIGGTVGRQASEVGLYWLAADENGNTHRILLMRWVPGYTLPAGTPINIYVAKGG